MYSSNFVSDIRGIAGDGVFSEEKDGNIILVDLKSGVNRTLVSRKDVIDVSAVLLSARIVQGVLIRNSSYQEHGRPLPWFAWQPSADMEYILFKTDHVKV